MFINGFRTCIATISVLMGTWLYVGGAAQANDKVTIQADRVVDNRGSNSVTAIGNVEIERSDSVLFADQVEYLRDSGQIISRDKLEYYERLHNNALFANAASVQDDLSCGNFLTAELFFADGSSLAADTVEKYPNKISTATNVRYYFCPSDNIFSIADRQLQPPKQRSKNSLFVMRAKRAVVDQNKNTISFYRSTVRVGGVPVFYWPKLTLSIPDGKKHSGFAGISYNDQTKLGGGLQVDYNWYLNDDHLVKLQPVVFFNGASLWQASYRLRRSSKNSDYDDYFWLKVAAGFDNGQLSREENAGQSRAYTLYTDGVIFLTPHLNLDHSIGTFSNRRYRYNFENKDDLRYQSRFGFKYTNDMRNYWTVDYVMDRDLTLYHQQENEPIVVPLAIHLENSLWQNPYHSLVASLDLEATSLHRAKGVGVELALVRPTLIWHHRNGLGIVEGRVSAEAQSVDYYSLWERSEYSSYYHPLADDYHVQRQLTQASLDWRLPQHIFLAKSSLVIEPRLKFLTTQAQHNDKYSAVSRDNIDYYYESSRPKELQIDSMFSNELFSGQELAEEGSRISYGFNLKWQGQRRGKLNFALAQMYIMDDPASLYQDYLYMPEQKVSNVVGKLNYISDGGTLNLYHQFTLDNANYAILGNEIGAGLHFERLDIGAGTTAFHRDLLREQIANEYVRNTAYIYANYRFSERLRFNTSHTWNLENGDIENRQVGLIFSNRCIELQISYVADYIEERERALGRSDTKEFNFNFIIKNSRF